MRLNGASGKKWSPSPLQAGHPAAWPWAASSQRTGCTHLSVGQALGHSPENRCTALRRVHSPEERYITGSYLVQLGNLVLFMSYKSSCFTSSLRTSHSGTKGRDCISFSRRWALRCRSKVPGLRPLDMSAFGTAWLCLDPCAPHPPRARSLDTWQM